MAPTCLPSCATPTREKISQDKDFINIIIDFDYNNPTSKRDSDNLASDFSITLTNTFFENYFYATFQKFFITPPLLQI